MLQLQGEQSVKVSHTLARLWQTPVWSWVARSYVFGGTWRQRLMSPRHGYSWFVLSNRSLVHQRDCLAQCCYPFCFFISVLS